MINEPYNLREIQETCPQARPHLSRSNVENVAGVKGQGNTDRYALAVEEKGRQDRMNCINTLIHTFVTFSQTSRVHLNRVLTLNYYSGRI